MHNSRVQRWFCALSMLIASSLFAPLAGQEVHSHEASEKLGEVSFQISCQPGVQTDFNRGIALLHSFGYAGAERAFQSVAQRDPKCAMAHWGIAMSHFHQLWEPAISAEAYPVAQGEIAEGLKLGAPTDRERGLLRAAEFVFQDDSPATYSSRIGHYEHAVSELAAKNLKDVEVQIFYALALLANASPTDKAHTRQKRATEILEPLFGTHPHHPGVAHYLIHAYDNAELASRGLQAARLYAKIAPSSPHALHMPSHIFTRLGLWQESIASNTAAREVARHIRDSSEEVHCMDYLVYAYLQLGGEAEAAQVVSQLRAMKGLNMEDLKVAYAATAIPVRYLIERKQWSDAAEITFDNDAPAQAKAIAIWAQGMGLARTGRSASQSIENLESTEKQLQSGGDEYWANQTKILQLELKAWSAHAEHREEEATSLMRQAADLEDAIEKLPVTPGPIVPAREQLGALFLEQAHPSQAKAEFVKAVVENPKRWGSTNGLTLAEEQLKAK